MNFIEGLPTSKGEGTIWVVVDRLTKYGHFVALAHPDSTLIVASTYLDNIFKLHGLPNSIFFIKTIFISVFWKELFTKLGTKLHTSTTYHPQTNGQTEALNRCLESYVRCMVGDQPRDWTCCLPLAEWWYNSTIHLTIQMTPYEVLYDPPQHLQH